MLGRKTHSCSQPLQGSPSTNLLLFHKLSFHSVIWSHIYFFLHSASFSCNVFFFFPKLVLTSLNIFNLFAGLAVTVRRVERGAFVFAVIWDGRLNARTFKSLDSKQTVNMFLLQKSRCFPNLHFPDSSWGRDSSLSGEIKATLNYI